MEHSWTDAIQPTERRERDFVTVGSSEISTAFERYSEVRPGFSEATKCPMQVCGLTYVLRLVSRGDVKELPDSCSA